MNDNSNLIRAIPALDSAGLLITGFSHESYEDEPSMKMKVIPMNGKPGTAAPAEGAETERERHTGEIVNLEKYLGAGDWRETLCHIRNLAKAGLARAFNPGDFILASFDVPAATRKGVDFKALHLRDTKIQIVEVQADKVIFNFDEVIFRASINAKNQNAGGFKESALAEYLNAEFLEYIGIGEALAPNKDGQKITLPTATEVFGDDDYWEPASNFSGDPRQFDFFKAMKNRIKVQDNDTTWWWLASPSAASAAYFCSCASYGFSYHNTASAVGGVAPAFCVA